jgi:hypothetical protein
MHYTYIDGKRVSNHAMKDYRTFIKLQEAVGSKQGVMDMQEPRRGNKQRATSKSTTSKWSRARTRTTKPG